MSGLEKPKSPLQDTEQRDNDVVVKDQQQEKETETGGKELPEPIRPPNNMMTMPPINVSEVKDMLCSPNMPEQKIMKLVASKLTSKAYNSDDGGSDGESKKVGMQGLFDCIIETTLCHSDHSDDESSDDEENTPRQKMCAFCNKVFFSNMRLTTHILVMHSRQDPSLLNERPHAPQRRELQRSLSKGKSSSGSGDVKSRSLLQSTLNVEVVPTPGDGAGVKHLSPRLRAKLSPKGRSVPRDQAERSQSHETAPKTEQPVDLVAQDKRPAETTENTQSTITSSPNKSVDLTDPKCDEKPCLEEDDSKTSSRVLRRRSAPIADEDPAALSSPSQLPSSSTSQPTGKVTRSSSRSSTEQRSSTATSAPAAPKRKSTDSLPASQSTSAKRSNKKSRSSQRSSSRRSR